MFKVLDQANRNDFCRLYHDIDNLLKLERLLPVHIERASLRAPNLDHIQSVLHMAIVNDILLPYESFMAQGSFLAFFCGYFPERYEKFLLFNQKLNLVMNHLYAQRRDFSPEEEGAINRLLHAHLEDMLTDPQLFSPKLGSVSKRINKALPITRYTVQGQTFGFFEDPNRINNELLNLQLENRKLHEDVGRLSLAVDKISTLLKELQRRHGEAAMP